MTKTFLILFLFGAIFIACEKDNPVSYNPSPSGKVGHNPPPDHAVNKHGYMHKAGLKDAESNCTECHGADLRGGNVGVSCYECHGKKWH